MRLLRVSLVSAALLVCSFLSAALHAQIPATITHAIDQDPAPDKLHPAAIETFQLPSRGSPLNALMYIAAGAGPHPTVLLLHGFPGNEKNLDLAQVLRRNGYDAFVAALKKSGSTHVTTLHLTTDHSYSDHRIALETSILNWLATL